MIFRNAEKWRAYFSPSPMLQSCSLAEPLTPSAKVSCRTLQIAEPKALNLEKDYLAEPWNAGSLDGPIRANRFADSRESPDSRESFQGSRTEPLFCESRFGGAKKCESQV